MPASMQPMVSTLFFRGTQMMLLVAVPVSSSTLRVKRSSSLVSSTIRASPLCTTVPAIPCPFSMVMPLISTKPRLKIG